MQKTCRITGQTFETTAEEMAMRRKLGVEGEPDLHPVFRFMLLGAFWQHWNLYKRSCGKTGKPIISVYPEDCPYPVWHKDEWVAHADPPGGDFDSGRPVFPQLWEIFTHSPIAHNMGVGNENCEYTDDWWYSKNCYLCHSGYKCEDLRYCYRTIDTRDSQFCVFTFDSERCVDVLNSHGCFRVLFSFNCWQCSDSAFLYDCRNCTSCMFCCNLRNKQYCFGNEQLSKKEYERKIADWDCRSHAVYESGKSAFRQMMRERAWHRSIFIDRSEQSTGNYLDECKNCTNCYFLSSGMENCVNVLRAGEATDCLDCIGPAFKTALVYWTTNPQDQCYDVRYCYNVIQCRWSEYCAHCFRCEHCFGCCGLVGKKYHILNKPYSPDAYEQEKKRIVAAMKESGEYGQFFPGYFAATPYEETISGFYWPLDLKQSETFGFRTRQRAAVRPEGTLDPSGIPDRSDEPESSMTKNIFWDAQAQRPFQLQETDIAFARDAGVPLSRTYYARRIQENFRLIPFNGTTRLTACPHCATETPTSWPEEYDGRILCEACYLKEVY